jgi:hypothetical protein
MNHKSFSLVAGVLFLVIAVAHLARIVYGWDVTLNMLVVPMWVSWIALAGTSFLAYSGLRLARE